MDVLSGVLMISMNDRVRESFAQCDLNVALALIGTAALPDQSHEFIHEGRNRSHFAWQRVLQFDARAALIMDCHWCLPVETCFRSGVHLSRLGDHVDCINPRGIKRQVLFNAGNRLIRFFVSPNGIFRFCSADGNTVVSTITLVRTISVMRGPNEQRHVCIIARQVINRRISLLFEPKRLCRFGDNPPGDRHTHLALGRRNRNRMVRSRNFDLLAFARLCLHCAPHVVNYSFEPPSTGMLAPVIQRAPSDATKATTSATSSGLPIRFNACIPNVTSRPASVFVKFDMSVSITPGATALTRMPCGPRMAAQFLTKVSSAPLAEA